MSLLLDENLSYRLRRMLVPPFDEVAHVSRTSGERSADEVIVRHATSVGAVVVTFDSDPVDIAERFGPPAKVVRVGLLKPSNREVAECLRRNFDRIAEFADDPLATALTIE